MGCAEMRSRPDGVQGGTKRQELKGLSAGSMPHVRARFKPQGGGHERRP